MDAIYLSLNDNERPKYLLRVDNENTCKIIGKYINVISIIYIFSLLLLFFQFNVYESRKCYF